MLKITVFLKTLLVLTFFRPSPNSVYDWQNPKGIKFVTRLRLGLSHLQEHKFKCNFQGSLNPIRHCGRDVESTSHLLFYCPMFTTKRKIRLSTLNDINQDH